MIGSMIFWTLVALGVASWVWLFCDNLTLRSRVDTLTYALEQRKPARDARGRFTRKQA
jgi:hypothetical protein